MFHAHFPFGPSTKFPGDPNQAIAKQGPLSTITGLYLWITICLKANLRIYPLFRRIHWAPIIAQRMCARHAQNGFDSAAVASARITWAPRCRLPRLLCTTNCSSGSCLYALIRSRAELIDHVCILGQHGHQLASFVIRLCDYRSVLEFSRHPFDIHSSLTNLICLSIVLSQPFCP